MVLALGIAFILLAALLLAFRPPLNWVASRVLAESRNGMNTANPYLNPQLTAFIVVSAIRLGTPGAFLFGGSLCVLAGLGLGVLTPLVFVVFVGLFVVSVVRIARQALRIG